MVHRISRSGVARCAAALVFMAAAVRIGLVAVAQQDDAAPAAAEQQPAAEQPTAEQVRARLLQRRAQSPLVEPTVDSGPAAASLRLDPVGVAPSVGDRGIVRREGSFVILRRGRMIANPGRDLAWTFVLEADQADGEGVDAPMTLLPCRLLEDMEQIATRRGDSAVFEVSGEVFVYRGANYLMPTVMRLAPERSNLSP